MSERKWITIKVFDIEDLANLKLTAQKFINRLQISLDTVPLEHRHEVKMIVMDNGLGLEEAAAVWSRYETDDEFASRLEEERIKVERAASIARSRDLQELQRLKALYEPATEVPRP
jgi:hypothetical protein